MIKIRKAKNRGHFNYGWLDTYHTFSFSDYHDPEHMGFRALRVINEDYVQPGRGFRTHSHNNMEILTYILEGALEHKDSMGNTSVIKPGEVQRMSAGTGVTHSEFNHSKDKIVHLLQIWILPEKEGMTPGYEQKHFSDGEKKNRLRLVASRDGRDHSVKIFQDVNVYDCILEAGRELAYEISETKYAWIQMTRGKMNVDSQLLTAGDGASLVDCKNMKINAVEEAAFLVFELQ